MTDSENIVIAVSGVQLSQVNDNEQDNKNDSKNAAECKSLNKNTDVQKQQVVTESKHVVGEKNDKNDENIVNGEEKEDKQDKEDKEDNEEGTEIEHVEDEIVGALQTASDKKIKKWDCISYLFLLVIFISMAVLSRGAGDLSYTQTVAIRNPVITDLFEPWNYDAEKKFSEITTINDIYNYIKSVPIKLLLNDLDDATGTMFVQQQQILLGGIRVRQSRRKQTDCELRRYENHICYSEDESTIDEITWESHDIDTNENLTLTLNYASSQKLDDQSWRAKFGSYPGGGYYIDLPLNMSAATAVIQKLQSVVWINEATRYVGLDFNTYNPSSCLHTVCRIAFELPSGGVFPTEEFKTYKFDRYRQSSGIALFTLHIFFIIVLLAVTLKTLLDMYRETCWKCGENENKQKYYWNVSRWRVYDFVNLIFFYIAVIYYISNQKLFQDTDVYNTSQVVSFRALQYGFTQESYVTAFAALLLVLKLFKFLQVNRRLQFLFLIFRRAGYDLFVFGIILFVFLFAFGFAGFLTFSSDVDDFRSLVFGMGNMLRYTVSDMEYTALSESSRLWGSMFYFAWSLLMILILVNVFIAILSDAYSQVQIDLSAEDKINFGLGSVFGKLGEMWANWRLVEQDHGELDDDGDGQVDIDEFVNHTKCTLKEAQDFFDKYDLDNSGKLSMEEYQKAKTELEAQRVNAEKSLVSVAMVREINSGRTLQNSGVVPEEWQNIKNQVVEIRELLVDVLQTTKVGRSVLQKRK